MSVGAAKNKGEEQYHGSCNGESDTFATSTPMEMGGSSPSAMYTT